GFERFDHIHYSGVSDVLAVFLESQAHDENVGVDHVEAPLGHQADDPVRYPGAYAVVDPPAREDHLRMIAHGLGLMGEIIRVDADTVSADQARPEGKEVPFGTCRFQYI